MVRPLPIQLVLCRMIRAAQKLASRSRSSQENAVPGWAVSTIDKIGHMEGNKIGLRQDPLLSALLKVVQY